jgi:hypothetical protein
MACDDEDDGIATPPPGKMNMKQVSQLQDGQRN